MPRSSQTLKEEKKGRTLSWYETGVTYWNITPGYGDVPSDLAKREVAKAKKIGATHFSFFVDLDGLMIYPSKYVPQDSRLKRRDLLRELVEEARKAHLKMIAAWMGMHVQTYLLKEHPDWELIGLKREHWAPDAKPLTEGYQAGTFTQVNSGKVLEGKDVLFGFGALCINSPHRGILLGQFEEVIKEYQVDGIYQDGLYFPEAFCFCNFCRKKYRDTFGVDCPIELLDSKRAELREESLVSFTKEVRDVINRTKPDAAFLLDSHGTIIGTVDSRESIYKTCRYADAYILECYPEVISEHPYYVGMEMDLVKAETKKAVLSPKWIAWNPDTAVVSLPKAGIKIWAWQAVMHGAIPLFIDQRVADFCPNVLEVAKGIFADVKKAQEVTFGATRPKYAALLHSMETKFQTLPYRPREHRRYFEGWWTALEAKRIPFDVVTEEEIASGAVSEYDALILPNVRCMSEKVVRAIEAYVGGGGGLVITGCTSLEDENANPRNDFALGKVAGISLEQIATTKERYGRALTNYYRVSGKHPISGGLAGETYAFSRDERMVYVKALSGTKILFRLTGYDEALIRSEKYFVAYPSGIPGAPVVLCREEGGRVVSIPAPLDATYWELGWPETLEILSRSVVWAARKKPPFAVDAPPCVHAALFSSNKSATLLLLNSATNPQYSIGFPGTLVQRTEDLKRSQLIGYVVPIKDVALTLALPKRPKKVFSITGQKVNSTYSKGSLAVRIPELAEYEGVVAEL